MKIATLAIVTRGDQVLLGLKKGNPKIGKDTLNGPGGHLKSWETILLCLLRETWEEVRIVINPFKVEKVAIITFYAGGMSDEQFYWEAARDEKHGSRLV